jgi:hypothetical protein
MGLATKPVQFYNLHIGGVGSPLQSNYSKWGNCHMCMNKLVTYDSSPPKICNQLWCPYSGTFFRLFRKWNQWTGPDLVLTVPILLWNQQWGNTPLLCFGTDPLVELLPDRIASRHTSRLHIFIGPIV